MARRRKGRGSDGWRGSRLVLKGLGSRLETKEVRLSSDGRARLTARAEEARLEEGAWLTARIEGLGSWLTARAAEARLTARMEVSRLAAR